MAMTASCAPYRGRRIKKCTLSDIPPHPSLFEILWAMNNPVFTLDELRKIKERAAKPPPVSRRKPQAPPVCFRCKKPTTSATITRNRDGTPICHTCRPPATKKRSKLHVAQ